MGGKILPTLGLMNLSATSGKPQKSKLNNITAVFTPFKAGPLTFLLAAPAGCHFWFSVKSFLTITG